MRLRGRRSPPSPVARWTAAPCTSTSSPAPTNHPYDLVPVLDDHKPDLDDAAARFVAWFRRLIEQPSTDDAWDPNRFEYRFACAAPDGDGEQALVAEGYAGGRLDWPSVDFDPDAPDLGAAAPGAPVTTHTYAGIPAPAAFDGMPNLRYWAFEDGRTNLGDVRPDTTDLAKLLFLEFGLVYANDWFLLPCDIPVGSLARIRGLSVTNVFGERFWIERAGSRAGETAQKFALYTLGEAGLAVLPTVPKVQEADPIEQVALVRDEMANMVWGIETVVPLASGRGDARRRGRVPRRSRTTSGCAVSPRRRPCRLRRRFATRS